MSKPFIRYVELKLKFKDQSPFMTIKSDGSRDDVQISFSINKKMYSMMNESTIVIYNIKAETRQTLTKPGLQAELYVGWKNISPVLLAQGNVVQVKPVKNGVSNNVTLTFFDGYGAITSSILKKTYVPNLTVKSIVYDLATNFQNVRVDKNKIDVEGRVGSKGYTVTDRISVELDKLANIYNFTWSIQNNVFQALKHGAASKTKHEISNNAGNLFNASPVLNDPSAVGGMTQTGMEITAFMNPQILPGDVVTLKSSFVPQQYNGDYTVHVIDFNGDTFGAEYSMKIQSNKYGTS